MEKVLIFNRKLQILESLIDFGCESNWKSSPWGLVSPSTHTHTHDDYGGGIYISSKNIYPKFQILEGKYDT